MKLVLLKKIKITIITYEKITKKDSIDKIKEVVSNKENHDDQINPIYQEE